MKYLLFLFCLVCPVFFVQTAVAEFSADNEGTAKSIYGVYERVVLPDVGKTPIKAKLDTGAITTSLGADHIEIFQKNGEDWVRFTPQVKGAKQLERPLIRHSNIKLRAAEKGEKREEVEEEIQEVLRSKRPVVLMDICFDGTLYTTEVNLTDRSHFLYPVLLGRISLVEFHAIVDPDIKYLSLPSCP